MDASHDSKHNIKSDQSWSRRSDTPAPSFFFNRIDYLNIDLQQYDNHFIKLIVLNKTDDEQFDKFVERLYNEITVHDLNIIEDYSDIKASVRDDVIEMGEDTVTFLNNYVDQLETDVNKTKLKEYLKSFYVEASEAW